MTNGVRTGNREVTLADVKCSDILTIDDETKQQMLVEVALDDELVMLFDVAENEVKQKDTWIVLQGDHGDLELEVKHTQAWKHVVGSAKVVFCIVHREGVDVS